MPESDRRYRSAPAQIAAFAVIIVLGLAARLPSASSEEVSDLAKRFHFAREPLPLADRPATYTSVDVNPTVAHLRQYLSTLTSSVALGDLDEDGLSNDVCHVEMRAREIIMSPAPGTGERYQAFALPVPEGVDPDIAYPAKCLFTDFNEDGLADLFIGYAGGVPFAFLRRTSESGDYSHPSAADFAAKPIVPAGTPSFTTTAAVTADIDGDGHDDLLIGNYFPDGSPLFNSKIGPAKVDMNESFSNARNGGKKHLMLWQSATSGREPDVRFREVTDVFPGTDATGWTLAIGAADLDRDGLVDLYIANDFGPDTLYANRSTPGNVRLIRLMGEKTFTQPKSRVLGYDSFKSMGVDFADINGDGLFDMFVSNIAAPWAVQESHFLWTSTGEISRMNDGVAPYVDRGEEMGVAHSSWGWDSRFADFDNDGVQEAIQATGFVKGRVRRWANFAELAIVNDSITKDPAVWPIISSTADISGHDPNPLYTRGTDGRFVEISAEVGLGGPWNTRSIAIGDVDGDGDDDFIFGNVWEDSQFYRNDAPAKTFLSLHVLRPQAGVTRAASAVAPGHPSSPVDGWPAYGAVATLKLPDGTTRIGQVDGGSGHTGARSADVHFGLGALPADTNLTVNLTWRDDKGKVRREDFAVKPGWQTVRLASGGQ